jgi:2-iminobutanoate/2-iminopropanoate deaminase
MKNLQAICQEAGVSLDSVVKTTVFVKDLSQFTVVNNTYGEFFQVAPPARACVEVSRLPKDVLVEIEAIVLVN